MYYIVKYMIKIVMYNFVFHLRYRVINMQLFGMILFNKLKNFFLFILLLNNLFYSYRIWYVYNKQRTNILSFHFPSSHLIWLAILPSMVGIFYVGKKIKIRKSEKKWKTNLLNEKYQLLKIRLLRNQHFKWVFLKWNFLISYNASIWWRWVEQIIL